MVSTWVGIQMVPNRSSAGWPHRQRCKKSLEHQAQKETFGHGY